MGLLSLYAFSKTLQKSAAAKGVDDLPPGGYLYVRGDRRSIRIEYRTTEDYFRRWGSCTMSKGSCGDTYVIGNLHADHGWGPLLSDLAIEIASLLGNGVVSDRNLVSLEAIRLIEYYQKRSDVRTYILPFEECPFNIVNALFKQDGLEFADRHPAIRSFLFVKEPFKSLDLADNLSLLLEILRKEDPSLHRYILEAYDASPMTKRIEKSPALIRKLKQEGKIQLEGISL